MRRRRVGMVLCAAVLLAGASAPGPAADQPAGLGAIAFPTSGSPEAQRHFLRGVGALHSFWYEEALKAFREATAAEPGFVMGYWGEAMAHNHPVWLEQDTEAGRAALARIAGLERVTERERAYVEAVTLLYGEGEKPERDRAHARAMERLARAYPDDLEAACFHALALLGIAKQPGEGVKTRITAGAVALEVFRRNPDHPCAAHYTIHAFDDPEHAILALPAAKRYAAIAPAAHHAQHMPAHIFLQLGLWPEAEASNRAGWEASKAWVAREGLTPNLRDYHSLHWLTYVLLQRGRYREAEALLAEKRRDMLAADRPRDAAKQFATSLARHPNRARSLLGAARAAARAGDRAAAAASYAALLEVWAEADQELPELREARDLAAR